MSTISPPVTALSVRGLSKSYGPLKVLKNVDLDVARGEVVAIIGPSGSGKSTFIRCINRLEQPDGGTIVLDGEGSASSVASPSGGARVRRGGRSAARPAELRALRRKVGMVFQSFNLFPTHTALENVVLPQIHSLGRSRQQAEARARELLSKVGLGERADHKPSQLSGGQQQRVAIARALALDPEIMLFDEPTSAIDPELRVEVLRVMRDVAAEGMTMLVVTHEMNFARQVADRVVFFADGTIVESAEPATFFASPQHERTRRFLAAVLEEEL